MKRIVGTLFIICIALSANAQLLWKISGNGLEKPSYLFGTHHLASYSIIEKIEGLRPAFRDATQVVGELKMSDVQSPAAMQLMQQKMMMTDDKTIESLFTTDEYALVNKYVKENMQFDLNMMPKLKPAFITNNIVLLLYMKNMKDYNPDQQLDTFFQNQAKENGKTIEALETMEFQVDLLFNSTPVERQAELLVCTLSDVDKTLKETQELADAYMAQDLKAILKLTQKRDGNKCDPLPGEFEAMADDRNIAWMEKLPGLIKDQSTFVAVGALHLVGEKGLLNLLKKAGYTLEPVK